MINLILTKIIIRQRYVSSWRRVQDHYSECISPAARTQDNASHHKRTPEQLLCGLMKVIWGQLFILWEERNQGLHDRDTKKKQSHLV